MVVLVFVVGDMVMVETGVNSGAMVVASFVVDDVLMLVMGKVRSPCYDIGEARKNMQPTKQWGMPSRSSATKQCPVLAQCGFRMGLLHR
jgi:hypothetical protein